jgi:hypothetical protein
MRTMTRELLSEGCTRSIAFRWADGYRQVAYFKPDQAIEHIGWLRENPIVARRSWARDVATGRFCRV